MSVTTKDLFGQQTAEQQAKSLEALKGALNKSAADREARLATGQSWTTSDNGGEWIGGRAADPTADALSHLSKSVSPEVLASLRSELATAGYNGEMQKDISLTSPLASGLVPYDLEAPAKLIFPVLTPLRNSIPRVKGQGTSRRFKRITGITGSGTGGVANLSPFINDSSTMTSGSLTLRRGPKIAYAADEKSYTYKQAGLSDVVLWSAQYAGLGFDDPRQLSLTSLLYASMLADERAILAGRGTDAGVYVGALGTPVAARVVATARAAGVGETGNSANIPTVFIRVSAEGIFGESIASAEVTTTSLSATTGSVLDISMTGAGVTGATGYRVYVGSATGITNQFYFGRAGGWGGAAGAATAALTIQFTGGGLGGVPSAGAVGSATETASSADAWDGLLTVQTDPTQSGAILNMAGTKFNASVIGNEFQRLFSVLYNGQNGDAAVSGVAAAAGSTGFKADPDRILMAGQDRKQLSNLFLSGGSGNPTFFMAATGADTANMRMGQTVTGILNETTGKEVAISVHPYMPQGNSLVLSDSLPIPDSNIPAPFQYVLPQDYMAINWPVVQHTYDISSYWFGALVHYAPMFSGAITGILQG